MNLLQETIAELNKYGYEEQNVRWVGSKDGAYICSWEEFTRIGNLEYYCDHGAQEIAEDLVVVGEDFWLERHEYDGAETWELKQLPTPSIKPKLLTRVGVGTWHTVDQLEHKTDPLRYR